MRSTYSFPCMCCRQSGLLIWQIFKTKLSVVLFELHDYKRTWQSIIIRQILNPLSEYEWRLWHASERYRHVLDLSHMLQKHLQVKDTSSLVQLITYCEKQFAFLFASIYIYIWLVISLLSHIRIAAMTTEQGKILTIKPEFLSQMLVGDKNWEIRKSNSHHRGPVIFAASGTGKVWGVAMMENAIWKSSQDLQTQDAFQCHQLSSQQLEEYGGALGAYAWVFRNPRVFQDAVTFKPKRGAIVWHQMTQGMVNSVAAARRMPNPDRTTLLNAMETAVASAKMEEKEPSVLKSGHAQSASRTRCKRKVDDNVSYEPRPTLVVDPWGSTPMTLGVVLQPVSPTITMLALRLVMMMILGSVISNQKLSFAEPVWMLVLSFWQNVKNEINFQWI